MKTNSLLFLLVLSLLACEPKAGNSEADATLPTFVIQKEAIAPLNHALFGQFLEKPSWHGEWGPEAAVKPKTNELQDGVLSLMREMSIPVLRFPGGTDVDHVDWTDMIDLPNERAERPMITGNRGDKVPAYFGYDEAGALADSLGAELMLVVNFGDAYFERKSIEISVQHELGMLAYMSADKDRELPAGLNKWVTLRAENGHAAPYKVTSVQVANEPWVLDNRISIDKETDEAVLAHYFKCLDAFVAKISEVFPELKIIVDANCISIAPQLKERYGDQVDYVALHQYKPWGVGDFIKGEERVARNELSSEEVWKAWIALPEINDAGETVLGDMQTQNAFGAGYPIAMTEWNWNGWWNGSSSVDPDNLGSHFTKGMGAAGYLHAMMREAGRIPIGIQSMLVGNSWGITGIRVSPEESFKPYPLPTGQVTGFYASHHGDEMLKVAGSNLPKYNQPYKVNEIYPADSVLVLDVLASQDESKVYLHILNRSFEAPVEAIFDLTQFGLQEAAAVLYTLSGNYDNAEPCSTEPLRYACETQTEASLREGKLKMSIPARSMNVLEVALK